MPRSVLIKPDCPHFFAPQSNFLHGGNLGAHDGLTAVIYLRIIMHYATSCWTFRENIRVYYSRFCYVRNRVGTTCSKIVLCCLWSGKKPKV
jgi:hypothetical protein